MSAVRVNSATSRSGSGRGPTSDMSPRSTLNSCGSSSIDVRRSHAAERRDARIVRDLEDGPLRFVLRLERRLQALGVRHHRAELEHAEAPAVEAVALLRRR